MTQRLPLGSAPSIEALRRDVRARFKRVIDLVFVIGAGLLVVIQLDSARTATSAGSLLLLPFLLIALGASVLALRGRAPWSPLVYIAAITVAFWLTLGTNGPLAGVGAMTVIDITLGFVFLAPRWRWWLIGTLAIAPLVIGLLTWVDVLPAVTIRLADRNL